MSFRLIEADKAEHTISRPCSVLGVTSRVRHGRARSGLALGVTASARPALLARFAARRRPGRSRRAGGDRFLGGQTDGSPHPAQGAVGRDKREGTGRG